MRFASISMGTLSTLQQKSSFAVRERVMARQYAGFCHTYRNWAKMIGDIGDTADTRPDRSLLRIKLTVIAVTCHCHLTRKIWNELMKFEISKW